MQRKQATSSGPTEVPRIVHEVLRSPSQPLDTANRTFVESRLHHDFSRVRVHTDAKAAASAQEVNALAYTVGQHVVFGASQYSPDSTTGQELLAHELTHVVQQQRIPPGTNRPLYSDHDDPYEREARSNTFVVGHRGLGTVPLIQRQELFGPAATGTPADWADRVRASGTSTARAALVQEALGAGVVVVDRTNESASDETPSAAHLVAFTSTDPRINYDDNLQSKRSPIDRRSLAINAGYTLHSGGNHYVILGQRSLSADDLFATRVTLNHEFDHIRQQESGSQLRGNESELDAWTSTFIREFHRGYVLGVSGSICYVHRISEFAPLLSYFTRSEVSDTVRSGSVQRIVDYYHRTVRSHPGHDRVFRFWVHRTLKRVAEQADLARRLNSELGLGIDPDANLATTRQFDCGAVRGASFSGPPVVEPPTAAGTGREGERTVPGSARRLGLEFGGGISLREGERSAALSLGARYSLRSDQALIFNPVIGAQLLYLPSAGDRTTHLAAAICEIGLRVQQPLRGAYVDVRVGGYVGLELPTPGPRVEGSVTGALGVGYRWERVELGAAGRWLHDVGSSGDRFIIVGAGSIRF